MVSKEFYDNHFVCLIINVANSVLSLHRMASTIMQVYLKEVLEVFFTSRSQVRLEALNVIQLVLRQGLIHPVQVSDYY